ncbi:MAG: SIR2 family protein [archaeon]
MRDFNIFQLKDIRKLIEHFIVKFLLPDALAVNPELLSKFAKFIQPSDVIITFNYDLLIEQALWQAGLWSPHDGYLLGKFSNNLKFDESRLFKTKVPIIKLHGSVNWHAPGFFDEDIQIDLSHPTTCEPYFEGLGIDFWVKQKPRKLYFGYFLVAPTFMKTYRSKYEVNLVKSACDAISKCDEIYTLGYSFPEADALTSFLLAQIHSNAKIVIINRSANDIAEMLSENLGFNRDQIINEQSNIEDWISSGFKYLAYEHYLEGKKFMEDLSKCSKKKNNKYKSKPPKPI